MLLLGKEAKQNLPFLLFLRPRNSESDDVGSRRSSERRSTRCKGTESSKMILTIPGRPLGFAMSTKCRPISLADTSSEC